MDNKRALISLAYLKSADNPYGVFCDFIEFCLSTASGNKLSYQQLKDKLKSEFFIELPFRVIDVCIKTLRNSNKVERLKNGAGYKLISHDFDINAFNLRRNALADCEDRLLHSLCNFVSSFGVSWTIDEARKYLISNLIDNDNAIDVFLNNTCPINHDKVSPNWYVGKFITKVLDQECDERRYLVDVVNGLMVYLGVYQFDDYNQQINQKFRGTEFYVDTKLLLRILGYSWNLEVAAANDLVDMIVNEYEGKIGVFEHTISEAMWALSTATDEYKRRNKTSDINDVELKFFAELSRYDVDDFHIESSSIRNKIIDRGFHISKETNWSDQQIQKHNIDVTELVDYVEKQNPNWKKRAIENDAEVINRINILREGDYSIAFGGKKRLPIFVTTNSKLILTIKDYILEHEQQDSEVKLWNESRLPIISDSMLSSRLWLPKKALCSSAPTLLLAREAYASQQTDFSFIEKLRDNANSIRNKHKIDYVDIPEVRRLKLEEIVVRKSKGILDNINEELVSCSFEELVAMQTISQETTINELQIDIMQKDAQISKKNLQIIDSAAKRYEKKSKLLKRVVSLINIWWIIPVAVGIVISILVASISTFSSAVAFITTFITSLLCIIIDRVTQLPKVEKSIKSIMISRALAKFYNSISKSLSEGETEFTEEIIDRCVFGIIDLEVYSKK